MKFISIATIERKRGPIEVEQWAVDDCGLLWFRFCFNATHENGEHWGEWHHDIKSAEQDR